MENENKRKEIKIILGDFSCTMDQMVRNGGSKAQRIHRCRSNYVLSKIIVNNQLNDLWRKMNPDSSEFTLMIDHLAQDPG